MPFTTGGLFSGRSIEMPPCEEEDLGVALDEDEGGSTAQLGVQMQTTGSVTMSGYGIFEPGIVTVSCFSTVSVPWLGAG